MMPLAFILIRLFPDLSEWVRAVMEHGSYLVLFGLLFACGLGMPMPEDIPLLIAGAMVARGKMHLALAAFAAWCGIIGGDCVLYLLGRIFGLEAPKIPVVGRHLSRQRIEQVHAMFERWGVWVVAVGRMFAGIRGAMVIVAGAIRFTFWKFLLADGLAAVVSGGLFLSLGYLFGSRMDWLKQQIEEGKRWALISVMVLATGAAVWIYLHRRRRRRRHAPTAPSAHAPSNDQPVEAASTHHRAGVRQPAAK